MTVSFDLKANLRENLGSADSRRVIKAGYVPAVICDKNGKNLFITVNSKELEKEYFKGNIFATVVNVALNGKTFQTIPNKIDLNPVTDKPIHINFIKFEKGDKINAKVAVRFINKEKSKGLKKGGFLHIVLRKINLICNPDSIPDFIEVDIRSMRVGDKIRSTDLKIPADTQLSKKNGFTVASIIGRGTKETEEDIALATEVAEAEETEGAEEEAAESTDSNQDDQQGDTSSKNK